MKQDMDFQAGAQVITSDGQKLGVLERVVMDPRSKKVTDIVVGKGFLLHEEKVIPSDIIQAAEGGRVQLNIYDGKWDDFPTYDERYYVVHDEHALLKQEQAGSQPTMLFYYPPSTPAAGLVWPGGFASPYFVQGASNQAFEEKIDPNTPQGTVALKEGAKVVSSDGQAIGKVSKVLVQPENQRATHLVISEGSLFPNRKQVPVTWIQEVVGDEVHLAVHSKVLQQLPDYQETKE
jgi:sporulation protein YlmC with PRC-barrel domain